MSTLRLIFPVEELWSQGKSPLGWWCAGLREGQCGQHAAAALALLVGLIPYGVSLGTSALAPCSRIFSVLLAYS